MLIGSRDKHVQELEQRLASLESRLRLPEGRQFPGNVGSSTDPKSDAIAGVNEYQPMYITSHDSEKSLLGSAPREIEESAHISQTPDIMALSQQSIPSHNVAFLANSS